jgi:prefoldin subunit 5
MGIPSLWAYGEDLGSAIEVVEKKIAKIKTNKFDNEDLKELKDAVVEIITAVEKNENKN